jgi:hypothetical protein
MRLCTPKPIALTATVEVLCEHGHPIGKAIRHSIDTPLSPGRTALKTSKDHCAHCEWTQKETERTLALSLLSKAKYGPILVYGDRVMVRNVIYGRLLDRGLLYYVRDFRGLVDSINEDRIRIRLIAPAAQLEKMVSLDAPGSKRPRAQVAHRRRIDTHTGSIIMADFYTSVYSIDYPVEEPVITAGWEDEEAPFPGTLVPVDMIIKCL